jgi:polyhydroxybutyrate depolymerase
LNLPPGYYDATSNISLVIVLHGLGGSASQAEHDYGVSDKGNATGFAVVYPEGIQSNGPAHLRSWNTGTCCPVADTYHVNDVYFISTLIDKLVSEYKIDPKKIYVTGISNGAMMAYTLACQLSNKIAAIAPVSGTLMTTRPCNPQRAVPILHIHSIADTKVPYAGGPGLGGLYFTPVDSTLRVWSALDSCEAPQVTTGTNYTLTEWKGNAGQPVIDLYLTQDGGHSWPGGLKPRAQADPPSTAINATDVIWNFFRQYTLP